MDKITRFNDRIEKIKKDKLKYQTQQAVLFKREAEKIFADAFSPEIALAVMSDWKAATETKKKEWTTRSHSFRLTSVQSTQRKTETANAAAPQNREETTTENG